MADRTPERALPALQIIPRQRRQLLPGLCTAIVGAVVALGGCSNSDSEATATALTPGVPGQTKTLKQTAFRIRANFDADLNADRGWAGALNQPATVQADRPFRLRFEVENTADAGAEHRFSLQFRRHQGAWEPLTAEDFPYPVKKLRLDFSSVPEGQLADTWNLIQGDESALSWQQEDAVGFARFAAGNEPVLALARYQTHWQPAEFATYLRLPESARAGILFGYVDEDNHFRLEIEAGRALRIIHRDNGRETTVAHQDVEVKADHWIEIKVAWEGSRATIGYEWDPYMEGLEFTEDLGVAIAASRLGLYLPADSSAEVGFVEIEGETSTPGASIVSTSRFEHGAATGDLLAASALPFTAGAGINYADTTPVWSASSGHGEWEFPLVVRYFYDGPAMHEAGDTFEFRLLDSSGEPVPAASNPVVTLAVPERHLGGVFVETPVRLGPWEASNGDLYFLMEPSETDNVMMAVKSTDGGATWREVDGANRPRTGDLEGVGQAFGSDRIHTLHQTSAHVFYHVFRTSDHPGQPDTWEITDERLASPVEPPVQVADLALRSDGSVVGVYGNLERVLVRIRSPQGQWGEETVVDAGIDRDLSGPVVVRGANDTVHFAYTGIDGTAWYRQILPNGDLTPGQPLASGLGTGVEDAGGILPLVYLPDSDTVSIIYRLDNGELWERRADGAGVLSEAVQVTSRAVVTNASDAEQVGADAIGYGACVHVLFIEEDTGRLFHTSRGGDGSWSDPTLEVDGANVMWVRGAVVKRNADGAAYGYVYDAGSRGGSGMNKYAEVPLPALHAGATTASAPAASCAR